jgi:hypothetical protein
MIPTCGKKTNESSRNEGNIEMKTWNQYILGLVFLILLYTYWGNYLHGNQNHSTTWTPHQRVR